VNAALDESDLALIHALQITPRVTWAEAAPILGSSPATLAARWARLRSEGMAWVTAYPGVGLGDLTVALVEIDCTPGARADVVRHLCQDPRALTVEESARGRDLLLTVMLPDLRALTQFVLDDLPAVDGIAAQRTYLATEVHVEGSQWRLDALDARQVAAFRSLAGSSGARPPKGAAPSPPSPPPDAWPLIEALAADGRASAAELARRTGRNPATVRRHLTRLLASQRLALRCEVAQVESRWPISCSWLARVPPHEHARTVKALSTLPELRLCASTTGETNMMLTVWVRSLADLLRLERLLGQKLPWLDVVDTAVTLRTAKRMGWLLDTDGRCTGEVVPSTTLRGIGSPTARQP
jgi:DNA-binding Lrp family transcriptional regulator